MVNTVTQDLQEVNPIKGVGINIKPTFNLKNGWLGKQIEKLKPIVDMQRRANGKTTIFKDDPLTIENPDKELQKTQEAAKTQRDEEWTRADAIRKETQEREDNAVQRWVEDAKKAGVNISALGQAGAAASGGGITSETGSIDYTMTEAQYNAQIEMLMQEIDNNFQGNENEKDRIKDLIKTIIQGGSILAASKLRSK